MEAGRGSLHRPIGDAALPGQDGAVRKKGAESQSRKLFPDILLIFAELNSCL